MLTNLFLLISLSFQSVAAEKCDNASTEAYESNELLTQILKQDSWNYEIIPAACIEASMSLMDSLVKAKKGKFKPFAYCSSDLEEPEKSSTPICRSEKLVSKIQYEFQLVMDCLDIPAKAIFPLINVESGFYPNASAPGGEDTGIGQVTPIAALDVNTRWNWLENYMRDSQKTSCKTLLPYIHQLQLIDINSNFTCQMIDSQLNPLRNSLYTGYIFLLNSKYYRDYFLENNVSQRLSALIGRELLNTEQDEIIHLLNIVTYNMGFEWTRTQFVKFLELEESKANLNEGDLAIISLKITELKNKIQEAKKNLDLALAAELRKDLEKAQQEFDSLARSQQRSYLPFAAFHYKNFNKDSLIGFLRTQDSSRYIELVISRNEAIEKKLGIGTCSIFQNVPSSVALDYMKWHP